MIKLARQTVEAVVGVGFDGYDLAMEEYIEFVI
jgi:3-dehydroquinate dehydratase